MRRVRGDGRLHGDGGAVIIELALVAPILLFMVMGLIDFSWRELKDDQVTSAARDGGRVAILKYKSLGATSSQPTTSPALTAQVSCTSTGNAAYQSICETVKSRLAGTQINNVLVACVRQHTTNVFVQCSSMTGVDSTYFVWVRVAWNFQPLTIVGQTWMGSGTKSTTIRMAVE
jgi:Flp pilus assembly protein TadG